MGLTAFFPTDRAGQVTGERRAIHTPDAAAPAPESQWFCGLDLGQAGDFTALAVLEGPPRSTPAPRTYRVRALERWPLGTRYTEIATAVAERLAAAPLHPHARLILDQTGCGRPVFDLFAERRVAAQLVGVTITGGSDVLEVQYNEFRVPKSDLIGQVQVLLQNGQLQIAQGLREAATLQKELAGYQRRVTLAAHEQFGAWREGQHDDLLLALALACWYAAVYGYREQGFWR
jgi:hypothetical protein